MSVERTKLPARGRQWKELERAISMRPSEDTGWEDGVFTLWWPSLPSDVYLSSMAAYSTYGHANSLFAFDMPGFASLERELKAMIAAVLRAPPDATVTITAGGTESNFLALKAARNWGRTQGAKVGRPSVVAPETAHPSFDKGCELPGMPLVKVPVLPSHRADVDAIRAAIDISTVLVAGSAPGYPHGLIDDIPGLATAATEANAWMHVDACVGGFLLPFLRSINRLVCEFDFTIPGVWSISADLHKFGGCTHGISSLTLRQPELYEFQRFERASYATPGFLGSRPGGIVAAAWAAMQTIGEDGYLDRARSMVGAWERIEESLPGIPGLTGLWPTEAGIVVIGGSAEVPIPSLVHALRQRHRPSYWYAAPDRLHLLVDACEPAVVENYLQDLAEAVTDVRLGRVRLQAGPAVYATDRL